MNAVTPPSPLAKGPRTKSKGAVSRAHTVELASLDLALPYVKAALSLGVAMCELDGAAPVHQEFPLLVRAPGIAEPLRFAAKIAGKREGHRVPLYLRPSDDFAEGAMLAFLAATGSLSSLPPPNFDESSAPGAALRAARLTAKPSAAPIPREDPAPEKPGPPRTKSRRMPAQKSRK